jgi:hypothetical protein
MTLHNTRWIRRAFSLPSPITSWIFCALLQLQHYRIRGHKNYVLWIHKDSRKIGSLFTTSTTTKVTCFSCRTQNKEKITKCSVMFTINMQMFKLVMLVCPDDMTSSLKCTSHWMNSEWLHGNSAGHSSSSQKPIQSFPQPISQVPTWILSFHISQSSSSCCFWIKILYRSWVTSLNNEIISTEALKLKCQHNCTKRNLNLYFTPYYIMVHVIFVQIMIWIPHLGYYWQCYSLIRLLTPFTVGRVKLHL